MNMRIYILSLFMFYYLYLTTISKKLTWVKMKFKNSKIKLKNVDLKKCFEHNIHSDVSTKISEIFTFLASVFFKKFFVLEILCSIISAKIHHEYHFSLQL